MEWPFYHYKVSLFVSSNTFLLKVFVYFVWCQHSLCSSLLVIICIIYYLQPLGVRHKLFDTILMSPSFCRTFLLAIELFIVWLFLPFSATHFVSSHCLLASWISVDKLAINFVEDPLYWVTSLLLFQESFFVLILGRFGVFWCVCLWFILEILEFWDMQIYFF